jgi:UDP-2,3-diacylglucosamine hydrolase
MIRYFISDLHINNSDEMSELFIEFLKRIQDADELYILGDLFEIWLGDDLELAKYTAVIETLQKASKKMKIYFIAGNRDFLIGPEFFQKTKIMQLNDPYIFEINQQKICLTHGDIFCTLDRKYQFFRKIVRNNLVRQIFLKLPKFLRHKIGTSIRNKSQLSRKIYPQENIDLKKFDIDPKSIKQFIKKNNIQTIIHGHTHIPLVEHYDKLQCNRYVLSEWKKHSALILKLDENNKFSHIEQASAT